MADAEAVERVVALTGMNSVTYDQLAPSMIAAGQRAAQQWKISGDKMADVTADIYPFLTVKRRQAIVAWNIQRLKDGVVTKRGQPIPAENMEKRRRLYDVLHDLNQRRPVDIPSWCTEPEVYREEGWYLRSDCIWSKPNPMPESVTDRPTKSHEYVFLLSKSSRYFFDQEAVREVNSVNPDWNYGSEDYRREITTHNDLSTDGDFRRPKSSGRGWSGVAPAGPNGCGRNLRSVWTIATSPFNDWTSTVRRVPVALDDADGDTKRIPTPDCPEHGSPRSAGPTPGDGERETGDRLHHSRGNGHDPDLARQLSLVAIPPIPDADSVPGSSDSLVPAYSSTASVHSTGTSRKARAPATTLPCTSSAQSGVGIGDTSDSRGLGAQSGHTPESRTGQDDSLAHPSEETSESTARRSSCTCSYYRENTESISHFATFPTELARRCILAGSAKGDTVLDPFFGAGTVGLVAESLGRKWIGIELNPAYVAMANRRIRGPLFAEAGP